MSILTSDPKFVGAASGTWQHQMKSAIRDLETLKQHLGLPAETPMGAQAEADFPIFVPLPFVERMEPGNPADPLLLQVLPTPAEDSSPPGFSLDPLAESDAQRTPGLLQKYEARALMVVNGTCAVHCRYCFRRHFPYSQTPRSLAQWSTALDLLAADTSIEEVILSGGDPLTLVDGLLGQLIHAIGQISHVQRLRIHTRLPIMIPQRVTLALTQMLQQFGQPQDRQVVIVIHANHANELDETVAEGLSKLRQAGCLMLNQSVLLKGVNDRLESLVDLSRRLLQVGTMPYYLHQLDAVVGVSHYEVSRQQGEQLIEGMRAVLPGYAVPRYVKEQPGKPSKTVWS